MSQQEMYFEERPQAYKEGYEGHYDSSTHWTHGQKLSGFSLHTRSVPASFRLALAIVSIIALMIMSVVLFAAAAMMHNLASIWAIGILVLFYAAVIWINMIFNRR